MGEVAADGTMRKKKKGRPSLLDLQKRALKQQQQQQQQEQPQQAKNPNSVKNPNSLNSDSVLPNRRSTRRSSNSYAPEWIDGDDDEEEDEDDERKEKKHKLLRGLNSQKNNIQKSNSLPSASDLYGSDSNAGGGNHEAGSRRRKISAVRGGSDDSGEKVLKGTETLHESSVEPGPTTPLPDKKLLVFILDRLQKKDTYGVFSEPVDPEELPDYFDIVENPMDFSTLRKKLDEGAYVNLEQFEKDVLLICSNAMQYNSSDTIYFRQARAMQELAKKDFENLRQESDDSEPQPKVVRRGRPPGKMKKSIEKSPVDRVGPEASSDATLATGGDSTGLSNGYNLRKTVPYRYQPADASVRNSYLTHSTENYSTWSSEWENEFPASVVKAVMKYGKKPFVVDENKRDTYKNSLGSNESSVLTTFEGELKQLMVVGLSSEHGYARSLARFAAELGPVVWKIASKKIESVLPVGIEFGPGWVGENHKAAEKPKVSNNPISDNHLNRFQHPSSSSRDGTRNKEDMLETTGGLNSQPDSALMNSCVGGLKPGPSVLMQQKPMIHPDMNGFVGGFGYNSSSQMGMARAMTPTGKSSLEHTAVPAQMFGAIPTSNSAFFSMAGNDFSSNKATVSETSNGLLQSGNSSAVGSCFDPHPLGNAGFGGKSAWQGFLPYHQQQSNVPFPQDLNVGFLAPASPTTSMPIGSPRQPDLALQL